jgi:cytochrome P450
VVPPSHGAGPHTTVWKLVKELNTLGAKFNLSDSIWFCKNFDLQGFDKRLKDARDRYDAMMERIMKEHEDARKRKKETGDEDDTVKDLLDILLDIYEDENAEKRLTRENIKAFIMVRSLIYANICTHN